MSGLGAPARTATPTLARTKSTRLPATTLPSLASSSSAGPAVMTKSATAPSRSRAETLTPDWNVMVTLCPLARSNAGTSSSSTSRMAVELSSAISAALTAVAITAAPMRPAAAAAAIVERVVMLASPIWI